MGDLYSSSLLLRRKFRPKVVIAENVKGILLGNAIDYVRQIYDGFDDAGYYCQHFLLNSALYGRSSRRKEYSSFA